MKKILHKVRHALAELFVRRLPVNRLTVGIYYFLLDSSFDREHFAVFAGKRQHLADSESVESKRFTLRRNIHRLEKALIMRPLRKQFAGDYIEETVDCYVRVIGVDRDEACRHDEVRWFTDVLKRYFESIDLNATTTRLKTRFESHLVSTQEPQSLIPYPRSAVPQLSVSYDQLMQLLMRRRSTRWFLNQPVDRTDLDRAVLAAIQAPSACNRQPFEFQIVDSPEACLRIADIPMGTRGYAHNIPVMIVIVGRLEAYFSERDRHVIYIDASLAAMNLMLALETLGLASCPINWPDIEEKELAMVAALGLRPWERPIMLLAAGYPDPEGGIPHSQKMPIQVARRYAGTPNTIALPNV